MEGSLAATARRRFARLAERPGAWALRAGLADKEREKRLQWLDAALARGVSDAETGRVRNAEDVFQELQDRYADAAAKPTRDLS
jgi:predicted transcriptional regulator